MKNIIITIFILLSQLFYSQETKNIGDFDKLKVFDRLNVKLIPSNENEVIIPNNYEDRIEIINKNGELKIRMKISESLSGNDLTIDLHFKTLNFIDVCEGSYVFCEEILKQNNLDLNAKEGGEINLKLDLQNLTCRAVSGAILDLSGTTNNQNISLGSGGVLKSQQLQSQQSTINITTGGEATIFATEFVDAKIKAGGTVYIYGNPKQINKKTILGGTIIIGKE